MNRLKMRWPGISAKSGWRPGLRAPRIDAHHTQQHSDMTPMTEVDLAAIRTACADFLAQEGCGCCRGDDYEATKARLCEMLGMQKYDDGSGYEYGLYKSQPGH